KLSVTRYAITQLKLIYSRVGEFCLFYFGSSKIDTVVAK
uniref:Uncharacterized protein n=1 Tax=Ciona intestinalis TaxID=7719 RepID=H2Y2H1_CIOIN